MTNKGKLIYKIIATFTLLVPLPVYLFLSATLFNITPDYRMDNVAIEEVVSVDNFIYTDNTEVIYDGVVVYSNGNYGFQMDEDDILQVGNDFYNYELTDIKKLEIQKETSYKLPMTFFISVLGVGIVFLIIQGKMQWYKKYPRIATLIGLLTGTLVLYLINTIVDNIFNVFLVATVSWAVYCIEYLVNNNIINKNEADKEENDLISSLRKAIDNG